MIFTRKKIFMAFLFMFALSSGALAAEVGGAVAPSAPSSTAAPSSTYAPTIDVPNAPNLGANPVTSMFGENSTPANETLNSDFTITNPDAAPAMPNTNDSTAPEQTLTEVEINNFFDGILSNTTQNNSIGNLFRRLPRYGMSFFRRAPSTFAPMESVPVAQDYRINVGDQMTLSVWGIPEEGNYNFTINRDGMASIPRIGTIRLAGYSFGEAERLIRSRLNQYYTGFQMNLSMGRLSSIMVYVTGNAARPGAYTISSFSTLVNALIASGGPSANGTLRKIELKRNGKIIAIFDMYAMLMQGDKTQDVRLQAGDVIHIPTVGPLVGIAGEIQRPGVYELNGTTRVQDLLSVIGGLNARTFRGRVQYYRIFDNAYASAIEGSLSEFENQTLNDGDVIRLYPVFNFASSVLITGAVINPGVFAILPGHTKVSEIIERAGGLNTLASDLAEITRVTPSLEGPVNERFTINIAQALQGDPQNNLVLQQNDQITVLVIPDWKSQIRVTINGEVRRPGSYAMFAGERLSDLIERAGGFTPRAFLRGAIFTRVSVAREQRHALNRMADQMERDLLQSTQNTSTAVSSTGEATAQRAEFQRRKQLIDSLRTLDIMGRVITKVDSPQNIVNTEWDYELQEGDALTVPRKPLTVNIMGAVYSSSSHVYHSNMSINSYISAAGGALKNAHKRMIYLLKADGTTIKLTRSTSMLSSKMWKAPRGYSAKVEPGDTIVVPVKYLDRTGIESVKDTVDIIYKVAVAAGVILNQTNK